MSVEQLISAGDSLTVLVDVVPEAECVRTVLPDPPVCSIHGGEYPPGADVCEWMAGRDAALALWGEARRDVLGRPAGASWAELALVVGALAGLEQTEPGILAALLGALGKAGAGDPDGLERLRLALENSRETRAEKT